MRAKLVALAAALCAMTLMAETETVGGYTWTYSIFGGVANIYGSYNSSSHSYTPCISPKPTGSVTIPSTLGGKTVTGIGDCAFSGCSGLTSVTIPDSVTSIGGVAFLGCSGLTSVTIPDSVTSIGNAAFSSCSGLKSVTIPNSVTNIEIEAFAGCSGLTSVTIGDGVTSIGDKVFEDCSDLTSVTIPDGVKSIGEDAFSYCNSLTNVTIGCGVTYIGGWAFCYCSGLTSVTIPDSVTSIGEEAFSGCRGLMNVTIGNGVENIGTGAFSGCSSLTNVTIPDNVTRIGGYVFDGCIGLTNVTIPDSVMGIGDCAFRDCIGIVNLMIPNSVTNISKWAFEGCDNLKSVTIPQYVCSSRMATMFPSSYLSITNVVISEGVANIGDHAFYDCRGLLNVVIPNSVTNIGINSFSYCSGLTNITIPDSVMSFGDCAFYGCIRLESVHISDIADWCGIAFGGTRANPLCYAHNLYLNDKLIKNLTIPSGVTRIGDYAFGGCTGLVSVTFHNDVMDIGHGAFMCCRGLTCVGIPGSVTNIGAYAFFGCSGLEKVDLLEGVQRIGSGAFARCVALSEVLLPSTLLELGSEVAVGNEQAIWCELIGNFAVTNTSISFTTNNVDESEMFMLATSDAMAQYSCSNGNSFISVNMFKSSRQYFATNYVEWGEGVTSICTTTSISESSTRSDVFGVFGRGMGAFEWCSGVTNICLNEGLALIGAGAFAGCSNVVELIIPSTVERIGGYAKSVLNFTSNCCSNGCDFNVNGYNGLVDTSSFMDQDTKNIKETSNIIHRYDPIGFCSGNIRLKKIVLPQGLKYLGAQAFKDCTSLEEIDLPDGVTAIMEGTFAGCSHLQRVGFPSRLELIGGKGWFPSLHTRESSYSSITQNGGQTDTGLLVDQTIVSSNGVVDGMVVDCNMIYNGGQVDTGASWNNVFPLAVCDNRWNPLCLKDWELPEDANAVIWVESTDQWRALLSAGMTNDQFRAQLISHRMLLHPSSADYVPMNDGETYSRWLGAFEGCSRLKDVVLPDSVRRIAPFSFYDCGGLVSVRIPNGIAVMGFDAFGGGTAPTSVVVPWLNCGDLRETFPQCAYVTNLVLTTGPAYLGDVLVGGGEILDLWWHMLDCWISHDTILTGFSRLKSLTLPEGLERLGYQIGIRDTPELERLCLPATLREIGSVAIGDCALPVPMKAGYLFLGWYTASLGGEKVTAETVVTGDMTLYAHWAAAWTVTLNANGGSFEDESGGEGAGVSKVTVAKGGALGNRAMPVRAGYSFAGWWTKKSGGTKVTAKTKITKNVTYYAHWTPIKYSVRLVKEGKGSVSGGGKKAYKSKVTLKAKAASGYVFQGWWKMDVPDATGRVPPVSQKATYSFKVPLGGVTYKAKFITKVEDKAAIGMEFGGVGFGALALTDESGHVVDVSLPVQTNVSGIVTSWPIATTGATPVSVSVKGQPKGMKYDAKRKAVRGVPSAVNRPGTMTVTVKSAGASRSWTVKWRTVEMPQAALGSFYGWSHAVDEGGESALPVRKVTVNVTLAGKISASVGSLKLSGTGWTVGDDGMYRVNLRKVRTVGSGKKAKKYTDVLALTLDPAKGWMEDQLSGSFGTFGGNVALVDALEALDGGGRALPVNADTGVSARRNPYGDKDNADAKAVAADVAALGARKVTDGDGLVWSVKVSANGVATISRTTGTGKKKKTVSATAVVTVDDSGGGALRAEARFLVGGKFVSVDW